MLDQGLMNSILIFLARTIDSLVVVALFWSAFPKLLTTLQQVACAGKARFEVKSQQLHFLYFLQRRLFEYPSTPNVPRAGPQTHHANHCTSISSGIAPSNRQYIKYMQIPHRLSRIPRHPATIRFFDYRMERTNLRSHHQSLILSLFLPAEAVLEYRFRRKLNWLVLYLACRRSRGSSQ